MLKIFYSGFFFFFWLSIYLVFVVSPLARVMESSEDVAEECSSSESGWTTYIASPMHENKNHNDDDDYDDDYDDDSGKQQEDETDHDGDRKDEEGSDDSMASDASSGPSHQMILRDFKHATGNHQGKSSRKNPHKKVEKIKFNRKMKTEKDERYLARSGANVRKPH